MGLCPRMEFLVSCLPFMTRPMDNVSLNNVFDRRKIRLTEGNAKCRPKKIYL
jgi:hypothetical protein